MSVTMAKSDAITVFTIQSDPQSRWPPVCQILKNLCYNPMCCSVSQDLRKIQRKSHSVLSAMEIMIGLLIIGFGAILRASTSTDWRLNNTEFPYWLGALFITFGVMNVLSEMFASPCLVSGSNLLRANIYEIYTAKSDWTEMFNLKKYWVS
ncbi:hypothetical protein CHARACLAT_026018 [Characodon lateralis]|uniref:Uncharacterized protein n=1 Tax=Characodon lateralis TaxID=208331 RepID=A0ABU7DVV4_9TELE|nr:hypothetical protein [Characodon lateralis]